MNLSGVLIAPTIRKVTPRGALLGTLAGVSLAFIAMNPAMRIYLQPVIGLVCLGIVLGGWFAGVRFPWGVPAGLVAIGVGHDHRLGDGGDGRRGGHARRSRSSGCTCRSPRSATCSPGSSRSRRCW